MNYNEFFIQHKDGSRCFQGMISLTEKQMSALEKATGKEMNAFDDVFGAIYALLDKKGDDQKGDDQKRDDHLKGYVFEVTDTLVKNIVYFGYDENEAESYAYDCSELLSDEDDFRDRTVRCLREATSEDIIKYVK